MRFAPLAVVLLVAAAVRVWAIDFCLPSHYCRPDEEAVAAVAMRRLRPRPQPALVRLAVALHLPDRTGAGARLQGGPVPRLVPRRVSLPPDDLDRPLGRLPRGPAAQRRRRCAVGVAPVSSGPALVSTWRGPDRRGLPRRRLPARSRLALRRHRRDRDVPRRRVVRVYRSLLLVSQYADAPAGGAAGRPRRIDQVQRGLDPSSPARRDPPEPATPPNCIAPRARGCGRVGCAWLGSSSRRRMRSSTTARS